MKSISETQYLSINIDMEKSLLITTWKSATTHMKVKEFKEEMILFFQAIQNFKPEFILLNSIDFAYSIPPDLQDWASKIIEKSIPELGVKKQAILKTEHFFAQVSLEQLIEENNHYSFKNEFFQEEESAKKWLLST